MRLHAFVCVIKVSVPVSEVVGVEEGRVEILPQKSVRDTDKDFTGGSSFRGAKAPKSQGHIQCLFEICLKWNELVSDLSKAKTWHQWYGYTVDVTVNAVVFWHLPLVFYVTRYRSGGSYGLLWRLGRTQFSCPSRVLRDQWIKNLRTAVKNHGKDEPFGKTFRALCVLHVRNVLKYYVIWRLWHLLLPFVQVHCVHEGFWCLLTHLEARRKEGRFTIHWWPLCLSWLVSALTW